MNYVTNGKLLHQVDVKKRKLRKPSDITNEKLRFRG